MLCPKNRTTILHEPVRHVTSAVCKDLQEKIEGAQNRGPRPARAYAIKLRMDISQKPIHVRICSKNAGAQEQEKAAAQTLRQPAQSKFTLISYKRANYWENLQEKCQVQESIP